MTNQEIIDATVSECCIALFEDYALPLRRSSADPLEGDPELLFCGVIGFIGEQMRGALLLATSREPLGRTSPTSDSSLREWIAELTNQLLGRIKNKLIARGVTLHLSIPIVLRGQQLAPVPRVELGPCVFRCEGGYVCVWFDAELTEGFDLSQLRDSPAPVGEGESLLF